MIRLFILVIALFFVLPEGVVAQELSYGFRVGLNTSTFLGDKEKDNDDNSLESFSMNTGFHVGGGVRIELTELFGIRTEFLFTQKGTKRTYEGPSYFIFRDINGERIFTTGNKTVSLNIANAYIDFPILAYGKITDRLEVFGGGYFGFLVGSTASGEVIYTDGRVPNNNNVIDRLEVALDYNYSRDEPGEIIGAAANIDVTVGNENVQIPNTLTAYYDLDTKDGKPYKILNAGLSAGAAYFLNGGLYMSVIGNYGLVDVSRTAMDFSNFATTSFDFVTRDDRDVNLSIQFSLGFSF
ncbi:MAG: outer membrane beta-barrel protein [Bacteroidota bacterium]